MIQYMGICVSIYKEGLIMALEKEINVYLLDQLDLIEDVLEVAEKEGATETVELLKKRKKQLERKLYQQPPLVTED